MAVPTLREAIAAVKVFKETQPQLEAVKDAEKANKAARKTLTAHMLDKGITAFRGITMDTGEFEAWDDAALRAHLGDRVAEFRVKRPRRYFAFARRAAKKAS